MIIYGASGHAKVILDIIESNPDVNLDLVYDDDPDIEELLGHKVFHHFAQDWTSIPIMYAIGSNSIRFHLANKLKNAPCNAIIHKTAVLSSGVIIGNGTAIMAKSVINSSTEIGIHSIINTGALIEHDVRIGNFVHISPGAIITGNVQIAEGTHIGAGAVVIPGVKIGKWSTIGAGAVIIDDVPDNAVVVGNPGRVIKYKET